MGLKVLLVCQTPPPATHFDLIANRLVIDGPAAGGGAAAAEEEARVEYFYTLDGSEPTPDSSRCANGYIPLGGGGGGHPSMVRIVGVVPGRLRSGKIRRHLHSPPSCSCHSCENTSDPCRSLSCSVAGRSTACAPRGDLSGPAVTTTVRLQVCHRKRPLPSHIGSPACAAVTNRSVRRQSVLPNPKVVYSSRDQRLTIDPQPGLQVQPAQRTDLPLVSGRCWGLISLVFLFVQYRFTTDGTEPDHNSTRCAPALPALACALPVLV